MRYDKKDRQQYRKQAEYATRQTERETENMRIICYKKDRDTWRCDQHIYCPSKHLSPVQKCGFESWLGKVKGGGGRRGKGQGGEGGGGRDRGGGEKEEGEGTGGEREEGEGGGVPQVLWFPSLIHQLMVSANEIKLK